jgi:hypothetical protein
MRALKIRKLKEDNKTIIFDIKEIKNNSLEKSNEINHYS